MLTTAEIANEFVRYVPGFGRAKAQALCERFSGKDLYSALTRIRPSTLLADVAGVNGIYFDHVFEGLRKKAKVIVRLRELGFDGYDARNIAGWRADVIELFEKNPYVLMPFVGFVKIDRIAARSGVPRDDDRRMKAIIEYTTHSTSNDGHTVISLADLERELRAYTPPEGGWRGRIKKEAESFGIVPRPINGTQYLQTLGLFKIEMFLEAFVETMASRASEDGVDVEQAILRFEGRAGFTLTREQKLAIRICSTSAFAVLSGGAGVGKTTVLRAIYEATPAKYQIVQVALSGKAALRMAQASDLPARTIAALLAEQQDKLLDNALLVIDEASMLDVFTMYRLVKIISHSCRVLLVGDHVQLPPIGPGLVFHRLCEAEVVPKALLTRVQRQEDSTGIPTLGARVRDHELPELQLWNGETQGVFAVPCSEGGITQEVADVFVELEEILGLDAVQIIAPVKDGDGGVIEINQNLAGQFGDRSGVGKFSQNDKILCTANDYRNGLYNGLTGLFDGSVVRTDIGSIELTDEVSPNLDFGFCITVHKSQGSQWRAVIVSVRKCRPLDLTLVYTALTRATELVVFVGDLRAAREAVESGAASSARQVGFLA